MAKMASFKKLVLANFAWHLSAALRSDDVGDRGRTYTGLKRSLTVDTKSNAQEGKTNTLLTPGTGQSRTIITPPPNSKRPKLDDKEKIDSAQHVAAGTQADNILDDQLSVDDFFTAATTQPGTIDSEQHVAADKQSHEDLDDLFFVGDGFDFDGDDDTTFAENVEHSLRMTLFDGVDDTSFAGNVDPNFDQFWTKRRNDEIFGSNSQHDTMAPDKNADGDVKPAIQDAPWWIQSGWRSYCAMLCDEGLNLDMGYSAIGRSMFEVFPFDYLLCHGGPSADRFSSDCIDFEDLFREVTEGFHEKLSVKVTPDTQKDEQPPQSNVTIPPQPGNVAAWGTYRRALKRATSKREKYDILAAHWRKYGALSLTSEKDVRDGAPATPTVEQPPQSKVTTRRRTRKSKAKSKKRTSKCKKCKSCNQMKAESEFRTHYDPMSADICNACLDQFLDSIYGATRGFFQSVEEKCFSSTD